MLKNSVRLFTVGGIEVGVHFSWLIIFALVTWSLATGFFPLLYGEVSGGEELATGTAWGLAVVAALLLFASVLVHELAHSFVARARGLPARSITLFLFGGVSNLSAEPESPASEFLIAIVGPLTSLALAAFAFLASLAIAEPLVQLVFVYLAIVNALVAGFNLLPGFPLDGGRVLRSIAWKLTNSLRRGTQIAAAAGQLVGFGLIAWGLATLFLAGDFFGGLWIAAIGWFLQNAASASLQQTIVQTRLSDVRVGEIVRRDSASVAPGTTVAELIEEHLLRRNRRAMPVTDGDRLVGIVTLGDIGSVTADARASTRVGDVMGGRDGLKTVTPADTVNRALELFGEGDHEQLPVVEDGALIGMLTRADVIRQIQLREALDIDRERGGATP
jgi:Zn-dependent protease/CBS domain-containing protein